MNKELGLESKIFGGAIGTIISLAMLRFSYETTRNIYDYFEYHKQEIVDNVGNLGYLFSQIGSCSVWLSAALLLSYFAINGGSRKAAEFYENSGKNKRG